MIITVKVKTGTRESSVTHDKEFNIYLVSVKARPIEGEANKAVIALLSKYLNIPKSQISLKSGIKSNLKRFEY